MVHKIGMDYRQIIKTRKNKKSLPLIGKLKKKINVQAAKDQLLPLLKENEEKLNNFLDKSIDIIYNIIIKNCK